MDQFLWVHKLLDTTWVKLFGKEHRRLMHDEATVLWIERTYGPMAAAVAKSHIALDLTFSGWKQRNGFNTYQRNPRLKGRKDQGLLYD